VLFGEAYDSSVQYALVIIPALAVELVLSGPCTSYMTADDTLVVRYRNIKFATLLVGVVYVFLVEESLLGAVVVMMSARVASTVALYVAIRRQTGLTLDVAWLLRFGILALGIAAAGLATSVAVPGHTADLPVAGAVMIVTTFAGTRLSGLLTAEDLALITRVLPEARPVTDRLAVWIGAGSAP
jgi:hypothetical protein